MGCERRRSEEKLRGGAISKEFEIDGTYVAPQVVGEGAEVGAIDIAISADVYDGIPEMLGSIDGELV